MILERLCIYPNHRQGGGGGAGSGKVQMGWGKFCDESRHLESGLEGHAHAEWLFFRKRRVVVIYGIRGVG